MWSQIAAWQTSLHPLMMFSRMYEGWKNIWGAFWWHEGECWESFDIFLTCFLVRLHWLVPLRGQNIWYFLWIHFWLKTTINCTFINSALFLSTIVFLTKKKRNQWPLWHHKGLTNILANLLQAKNLSIFILLSWVSALADRSNLKNQMTKTAFLSQGFGFTSLFFGLQITRTSVQT